MLAWLKSKLKAWLLDEQPLGKDQILVLVDGKEVQMTIRGIAGLNLIVTDSRGNGKLISESDVKNESKYWTAWRANGGGNTSWAPSNNIPNL